MRKIAGAPAQKAGRTPRDLGGESWVSRLLEAYAALQQWQETLNDTTRRLLARLAGPEPPLPAAATAGLDARAAVRQYERSLLLWALARSGGQQLAAARLLGLRPTTMNEKMKRLGIR